MFYCLQTSLTTLGCSVIYHFHHRCFPSPKAQRNISRERRAVAQIEILIPIPSGRIRLIYMQLSIQVQVAAFQPISKTKCKRCKMTRVGRNCHSDRLIQKLKSRRYDVYCDYFRLRFELTDSHSFPPGILQFWQ